MDGGGDAQREGDRSGAVKECVITHLTLVLRLLPSPANLLFGRPSRRARVHSSKRCLSKRMS